MCGAHEIGPPAVVTAFIARERLAAMSAFTPKADIDERERHVRFVPIADIRQALIDG